MRHGALATGLSASQQAVLAGVGLRLVDRSTGVPRDARCSRCGRVRHSQPIRGSTRIAAEE